MNVNVVHQSLIPLTPPPPHASNETPSAHRHPRASGGPASRDLLTVPSLQGPRLRGDDDVALAKDLRIAVAGAI